LSTLVFSGTISSERRERERKERRGEIALYGQRFTSFVKKVMSKKGEPAHSNWQTIIFQEKESRKEPKERERRDRNLIYIFAQGRKFSKLIRRSRRILVTHGGKRKGKGRWVDSDCQALMVGSSGRGNPGQAEFTLLTAPPLRKAVDRYPKKERQSGHCFGDGISEEAQRPGHPWEPQKEGRSQKKT